jgi:hypothetical protein
MIQLKRPNMSQESVMSALLNEDERALRDAVRSFLDKAVRSFLDKKVAPLVAAHEQARTFPWELLPQLTSIAYRELAIHGGGLQGREISLLRGREEIIGNITADWACSAATWYPGAMIHQIGSCLTGPAGGGRIRCRSYASILGLDEAGTRCSRGTAVIATCSCRTTASGGWPAGRTSSTGSHRHAETQRAASGTGIPLAARLCRGG